jgi:hypothetical protein
LTLNGFGYIIESYYLVWKKVMNERIKELAEQAGWDSHHSKFDTRIEKFAELILEEIMQELIINGHDDAFIFLNKHFGVEE